MRKWFSNPLLFLIIRSKLHFPDGNCNFFISCLAEQVNVNCSDSLWKKSSHTRHNYSHLNWNHKKWTILEYTCWYNFRTLASKCDGIAKEDVFLVRTLDMVDRCINRRRVRAAVTWKLERWRVWPAFRYDWHVIMCANRKFRKRCVKIPSNQEPQNGLHRFYFLVLLRDIMKNEGLSSLPLSLSIFQLCLQKWGFWL